MNDMEDEDLDGSEEMEAQGMILGSLGDAVKALRKKRMLKPEVSIEVAAEGDGEGLSPEDPVAEGDGELSEAELAELEKLC